MRIEIPLSNKRIFMHKRLWYFLPYFSLLTVLSTHAAEIRVLSATNKGKPIIGAAVTWQSSGESSQQSETEADGVARLKSVMDDDSSTLLISKSGYSNLVANCPCDGLTYALSPAMTQLDSMRFVLTWGNAPEDLDAHLFFSGNHVFFGDDTGDGVHLDVDQTHHFGPETISLEKRLIGKRYVYTVQDFSHNGDKNSSALAQSGARVDIYVGQTQIRSYQVDATTKGSTWIVFTIDDSGVLNFTNRYLSLSNDRVGHYLADMINDQDFGKTVPVSSQQIELARQYNVQGEQAYHQGEYQRALEAFEQAVNVNPQFGQAYSNLGLVYQKLGDSSAALWANRSAIQNAYRSGGNGREVSASSYYNMARIYEQNQQWQRALDYYRSAKSNHQRTVYEKGIARMKQKLAL